MTSPGRDAHAADVGPALVVLPHVDGLVPARRAQEMILVRLGQVRIPPVAQKQALGIGRLRPFDHVAARSHAVARPPGVTLKRSMSRGSSCTCGVEPAESATKTSEAVGNSTLEGGVTRSLPRSPKSRPLLHKYLRSGGDQLVRLLVEGREPVIDEIDLGRPNTRLHPSSYLTQELYSSTGPRPADDWADAGWLPGQIVHTLGDPSTIIDRRV